MARDHYISQVHLRNFYSPVLGQRMHALRKADLVGFPCNSESQCRIENGNTNVYLQDERAVEDFLKTIEGRYNAAVGAFRIGKPTTEDVYVVAGFIAYVMSCSPAAMRLQSTSVRGAVEMAAAMVERGGMLPPAPAILGAGGLEAMIADGRVQVEVDPKFPQALGIFNILGVVAMFGNFPWDVILNPFEDTPFFTSDYPVANEQSPDPRFLYRVVPLAPDIAVRIRPDAQKRSEDMSFPHFRFRTVTPSRAEIVAINRELARSAESLVYYRDAAEWVRPFVAKNSAFRVETWNLQTPHGDGILQLTQTGTRRYQRPK